MNPGRLFDDKRLCYVRYVRPTGVCSDDVLLSLMGGFIELKNCHSILFWSVLNLYDFVWTIKGCPPLYNDWLGVAFDGEIFFGLVKISCGVGY